MKRLLAPATFLCALWVFGALPASAQVCTINGYMVNHNRFAYDTAEECLNCGPLCHSVPFGNWGVSSNVGSKQDADQFQGWYPGCNPGPGTLVEWNSCSRDYVRPDPDCQRLNFPDYAGLFPYPANGYPFTDSYVHNNYVPVAGGSDRCVDQTSPCGPNAYGSWGVTISVPEIYDGDGDGYAESGGCQALDGATVTVTQNFMTVYELDEGNDDLIDSLYFPNVSVTLHCFSEGCWANGDYNGDGWIDDIYNRTSGGYVYPFLYQDNQGRISYATDPGVPAKRIDAVIRIGSAQGYYSGPRPCDPYERDACQSSGGRWLEEDCSCRERCTECAY